MGRWNNLLAAFIIFLMMTSCNRSVEINAPVAGVEGDSSSVGVSINQALTEVVGGCSFTAPTDPTMTLGIDFKVTFASTIDDTTFTTADIVNNGTGGSSTLVWSLSNCGDDTNFKLSATSIVGGGTIIPILPQGRVQDSNGTVNALSTSTDNSVTFGGWYQEAYIKAFNADPGDAFGQSVSVSGDTLAVGTFWEASDQFTITNGATASLDNTNLDSGAVYVYKRTGQNWAQEAYIKASNNDSGDWFGFHVSLSGNTLAVGATGEQSNQTTITNGSTASSNNSNASSGAVYVYKRTGVNWAQEAYIKAVNNDAGDEFGAFLSLDGDSLAVGAPFEDSNQTTITNGTTASANDAKLESGAVYVYKRTGVTWVQEAYIKAANSEADDDFGYAISLSGDTLVVGADLEDSDQTVITNGGTASNDNSSMESGAVYVYTRTGSTWSQEAYIKAVNNDADDLFGGAVTLSGDTLAVVASNEDSNQVTITNGGTASNNNTSADSGAVYIYKRSGVTWSQEAYIKASNNDAGDNLCLISLSGDTLAVGTPYEDSNQSVISNGSTASGDNSNIESGAVYVYRRIGTAWSQEAYIKASNNDAGDNFGWRISLNGDTLAVAADLEDSAQTSITNGETSSMDNTSTDSGAVYVYRNRSRLFDVTQVRTSVTSSSVTLEWDKSGGTSSGYYVAYQLGTTAPANCLSGTSLSVGDVNTITESGLSANTAYSFRICATDGISYSTGMTRTLTTLP